MNGQILDEIEQANQTILDELVKKYQFEERKPGDFSAQDFAERTHLSYRRASYILKDEVKAGKLRIIKTGRGRVLFRKA